MLSTYAQQTMVDTLPIAACVFTGPNHLIAAANEQMLNIWNRTDTIIGQTISDAIQQTDGGNFVEMLDEVYRTGKPHRNPESMMKYGELEAAYFDLSFKPLRDKEGTIYGVVTTAVDVTSQVMAVQQLEQTVEELAATNEEMSALNEEYLSVNEALEAGSEELRATNDELFKTQDKLKQSLTDLGLAEERTRMATDAANVGIFDLDLSTGVLIASEKLYVIFGFNEKASWEKYKDAIHPDDLEAYELAHKEARSGGRLFYELRVVKWDGSIGWIRAEGKLSRDSNGAPARIIGVVMDITEQRRDKEIQRKLKTLADNSADLMSLLELNGVNSYINEAGKKMLGFDSDEEVITTPISDLHRPEDFEQVSKDVIPSVMGKGKWMGTMLVKHLKTGEVFPVFNYTIRIDDPISGKPLGVGAIMRDLRPELASKKALADSEKKLNNVTSAAPTALWMTDSKGELTYVNKTWEEWTGRTQEQHLGNEWLKSILPEDRRIVAENYGAAFLSKAKYEFEFKIKDTNGHIRWCQAKGQPQFDSQGTFSGYVGACIDLTGQKEIQQHKDDFISIASHELKTPITSLKVSLQLLDELKDNPEDPVFRQMFSLARKSTERVINLIDDLLNVGRLQQKQMDLKRSVFVLSQIVHDSSKPIAISSKKQISVTGNHQLEVHADEGRIAQVVSNLLSNAVKYAPEANVIDVVISQENGFAKIAVKDYGPGIAADKTGQLFKRYYRVNDFVNVSGLGLGLYISKEIVERHGGEMGVETQQGEGSTFWFTLPLRFNECKV